MLISTLSGADRICTGQARTRDSACNLYRITVPHRYTISRSYHSLLKLQAISQSCPNCLTPFLIRYIIPHQPFHIQIQYFCSFAPVMGDAKKQKSSQLLIRFLYTQNRPKKYRYLRHFKQIMNF